MTILLSDAGKRFNRDWIFRHFSYQFIKGKAYAITGPNGSGKSTLLQVLSGGMLMNEGSLTYEIASRNSQSVISQETIFRHVSICAPYLDLIEEMTMKEFLEFHHGFKPFLSGITTEKIISVLGLQKAANRQIRYFSSGMKQRLKLAQCILADTDIVLLDEPCTNLDTAGIELYHQLITDYASRRLIVVSSNDPVEYRFCEEVIRITDYKN